jgi:serine protease Do
MPAAPKMSDDSQKTAKALSQAYASVAEFVKPSVVQISVTKKGGGLPAGLRRLQPNPDGNGNMNPKDMEEMLKKFFGPQFGNPEKEQFGPPRGGMGIGSGFVYDDRGHIVTNNHVVSDAEKITVTFYDGSETTDCKVVGTDPQSDVAVIKVGSSSFPALPKGDSSKLHVGELVMAVGSPFQLSQSVTTGIVSALERDGQGINGPNSFESFIQTDAAINPGNSGGPLVNMSGEVIGINSAIVSGSRGNDGIGFAIPIDLASSVADMLIKDHKVRRARIGIALTPLKATVAKQLGIDENTKGILVGDVVPGSPADKAGLKQGDVIVACEGEPVRTMGSFRMKVAASEIAKPITLTYIREGRKQTASITPAPAESVKFAIEQPDGSEAPAAAAPEKTALTDFGIEVEALTPEVAKPLGLPESLKGVVITSVKPGSDADEKGLTEGTVITRVIHEKKFRDVTSVKEFQTFASQTSELTLVVKGGKGLSGIITISKAAK